MAIEIEPVNSPTRPLRLAIVNDYELVVAGLGALLSRQGPQVRVVETTTRLPTLSDVDIVLMDTFGAVSRGAFDVSTLARHARSQGAKFVVYSWVIDPNAVRDALSQGAASYLWKGLGASDLVDALQAVRSGRVITPGRGSSAGRGEGAVELAGASWPGRDVGLSAREAEVLALIAKGLSNDQIAGELYLGVNTVKTYIRTAYRKTGVRSRTQAVLWAIDHGFAMQVGRAFPAADGVGLDPDGHLEAMNLGSVMAVGAAVEPATSAQDDVRLQFGRRVSLVQTLVPDCMGLTLASTLTGDSRTLMAASETTAVLDAAQYLSDGPCLEAARTATVLALTAEQLLAHKAWHQFAACAATAGVTSTLSVPVTEHGRVVGTINLYASTPTRSTDTIARAAAR